MFSFSKTLFRVGCAVSAAAGLWANPMAVAAPVPQAAPAPPAAPAKAAPAVAPNQPVARVNGEAIVWSQLEPMLALTGPIPAQLPDAQRRELQREALSVLIDDLLLQQYVRKYVPAADPAEIEKKMTELVEGLKKQNKTLADLCKESHQTEAEIRDSIAQFLQWATYGEKYVTDAQLQKYFTDYKDFFDRVTVRASHIVIRLTPTSTPADKEAGVKKLRSVREQIVAGKADFAAAAREHSQCPSAANGGDIGNFPRKFVVDERFARIAFALKPGDVSDVVETEYGLHLIKVTERKPGEPAEYEKCKDEVRQFYMEDLQQAVLAKLRKEAKIEILLP